MGDFVGINTFVFLVTPGESARAQQQLAEQLAGIQQERAESRDRLLERRTAERALLDRAVREDEQVRNDRRDDINRVLQEQQRRRLESVVEDTRQQDSAIARLRDATIAGLTDEQRLAEQLRQVELRQIERREEERRRNAQQQFDQRAAEQRVIEAGFNQLARRGSVVDIVA
jgi:hypothetical protein